MKDSDHPLAQDKNWVFSQQDLGFQTQYVAIHDKSGKRQVRSIADAVNCRETVIHNIRQGLQGGLCQKVKTGDGAWEFVFKQIKSVDLADPATKEAGMTAMKIQRSVLNGVKNISSPDFVKVVNTVLGPMCVILATSRLEGEWWRTPEDETDKNGFLWWWGSDNFFLQHPVLVSVTTGLYRQAALLYRAGYLDRIIESVDYKEVEECLSTGSKKHALEILRKTRPWIEVPSGVGGLNENYPFPQGYWQRMHRLQIGARRHGYEKLLDQDFSSGWNLELKGTQWTGLYSFWGETGEYTPAHDRLMKLGRPIALEKIREKSGKKPASRDA